jgi:hypothetical protein
MVLENASILGLRYFRASRFLTAPKEYIRMREESEWIRWMRQLGLQSRRKKISNLRTKWFLSGLGSKLQNSIITLGFREAIFFFKKIKGNVDSKTT